MVKKMEKGSEDIKFQPISVWYYHHVESENYAMDLECKSMT